MNNIGLRVALAVGLLLTVLYILLFNPIYQAGDTSSYIKYAEAIASNTTTSNFIHRSPLYPWLLSSFIKPLDLHVFAKLVVVMQYILVFFTGIILYLITSSYFSGYLIPVSASILYYTNFSTIFYGYMVLTETLASFLFVISVWLLIKGSRSLNNGYFLFSGVTISLTVLCRFNTLPMVLVFLAILLWLEFRKKSIYLKSTMIRSSYFILPIIVLLNAYAFYNNKTHGFYGIFPMGGSRTVSRNAIINTLDGSESVSEKNKPVFEIFKRAIIEQARNKPEPRKGSLNLPYRDLTLPKLYSGYPIYLNALPELCNYFGIDIRSPEPDISNALAPFYSEIRKINRLKVWELRVLSLISSFRSSTGLIASDGTHVNIEKLPEWLIVFYKIAVIVVSVFVFFASIVYVVLIVKKKIAPNNLIMISIMLYSGFLFINFALATVADANRYKFPVEPFVIILCLYFAVKIIKWLRDRLFREEKNLYVIPIK